MRKIKVTAVAGSLAGLALFASVAGAALIKGTSGRRRAQRHAECRS